FKALQQGAGRFAWDAADHNYFAAHLLDKAAFRLVDSVDGVITSLGIDFGPNHREQPHRIGFVEDAYRIHAGQSGQHAGTVRLAIDGAVRAFDGPHGGVAVDRDQQGVAQITGGFEVTYMTGMQKVEAAIGDDE